MSQRRPDDFAAGGRAARQLARSLASREDPHPQWCRCAEPEQRLLAPLVCRHCGHELHLETLVGKGVSTRALRLRQLALYLNQPLTDIPRRD